MEAGGLLWAGGQTHQHSKTPSQKYQNDFVSSPTCGLLSFSLQTWKDTARSSWDMVLPSWTNQCPKPWAKWTSNSLLMTHCYNINNEPLPFINDPFCYNILRPTQRKGLGNGISGGGGLAIELWDAMAGWRKDQMRLQSYKMTRPAGLGRLAKKSCWETIQLITRHCNHIFVLNSSLWLWSSRMTDLDHLNMNETLKEISVGTRVVAAGAEHTANPKFMFLLMAKSNLFTQL